MTNSPQHAYVLFSIDSCIWLRLLYSDNNDTTTGLAEKEREGLGLFQLPTFLKNIERY